MGSYRDKLKDKMLAGLILEIQAGYQLRMFNNESNKLGLNFQIFYLNSH